VIILGPLYPGRDVWFVLFISLVLLFSACDLAEQSASQTSIVRVNGSSTVYPLSEAVAEEYRTAAPETRVLVGISGTGGGFKRFVRGEVEISGASRPIGTPEIKLASENRVEFIELPVAYDGIAVVVHPENDWCSSITLQELKRLWETSAQGKVVRWNQIRPDWPDRRINLFGPGVDSGTYDYFTRAVVGEEGASRGDFTSSEDDNVLVLGVAGDVNALGFFSFVYYEENRERLNLVAVDDGRPETGEGPVAPSRETVFNGTYQPLSRPVFLYVRRNAAERLEVSKFVEFYLQMVPHLAAEMGYIPLPETVYELVVSRFRMKVSGTVFGSGGSRVGVTIAELFAAESIG
jgi:phosphate transport system substrate-binding protein